MLQGYGANASRRLTKSSENEELIKQLLKLNQGWDSKTLSFECHGNVKKKRSREN